MDTVNIINLPRLVQDRRKSAALTQRGLADLAGLSVGAIRDLEQGRTSRPRPESLRRLAEVLSIGATDLAAGAPSPAITPGGVVVQVLGPLEVRRDGRAVEIGSVRQRTVLGLLALSAGELVPRRAIVDAIWPDCAPGSAIHRVQTYVAGLRGLLAAGPVIATQRRCYRLVLEPWQLDLAEFRAHLRQARATDLPGPAFAHFTAALDAWRGAVLADIEILQGHPLLDSVERERTAAIVEYADAGLALRAYREVLPRLAAAADLDPFNGAVGARLMRALAGCGQQVAALRFFERTRDRLAGELGIDPDPELLHAYRSVLRQELDRDAADSGSSGSYPIRR